MKRSVNGYPPSSIACGTLAILVTSSTALRDGTLQEKSGISIKRAAIQSFRVTRPGRVPSVALGGQAPRELQRYRASSLGNSWPGCRDEHQELRWSGVDCRY